MYSCNDCGALFEEPVTFYDDVPYGSQMVSCPSGSGCPYCKGNYSETVECESCGELCNENEVYGGLCKDCIKLKCTTFEQLFQFAKTITPEGEVNALITHLIGDTDKLNIFFEMVIKQWDEFNNMFPIQKQKFIDKNIAKIGKWVAECQD
jgi:hypothetical protein